MSATAKVEVLTAEVRVLMVGSRQVTLSVYAQLDERPPGSILPFGRVRTKTEKYRTQVVGADDEGNLCRSWIHDDGGFQVGFAGLSYLFRVSDNREAAATLRETAAEWNALPLIVLAGLR